MPQRRPLIIAATSDLFIQSRLKELADLLGHEARFSTDPTSIVEQAKSYPGCLIILDLETSEYDSRNLVRTLKQAHPSPRILAYYPHVRGDLAESARDVGVDYVVPNSGFLKTVKKVLEESRGMA